MKYMFFAICLSMATLQLEAAHFQSSVSVTPSDVSNEYWVQVAILKIDDQEGSAELIAEPTLLCAVGNTTCLECGSKEDADYMLVEVSIPEDVTDKAVNTTVLLQENHEVIYRCDTVFPL